MRRFEHYDVLPEANKKQSAEIQRYINDCLGVEIRGEHYDYTRQPCHRRCWTCKSVMFLMKSRYDKQCEKCVETEKK